MDETKSTDFTEQEKKDMETFASLPEDVRRHLLSYGAGVVAAQGVISSSTEKLAG